MPDVRQVFPEYFPKPLPFYPETAPVENVQKPLGLIGAFAQAVAEPFKMAWVGGQLPVTPPEPETLQAWKTEGVPQTWGEKAASFIGGLGGSIGEYALARMLATPVGTAIGGLFGAPTGPGAIAPAAIGGTAASIAGPAVAFGVTGAGQGFKTTYLKAIQSGHSEDEAVSMGMKAASLNGVLQGLLTTIIPQPFRRLAGAKTLVPTATGVAETAARVPVPLLKQVGAGAALGAGMAGASNVAQQYGGVEAPWYEGMGESALTMGGLPIAVRALFGAPKLGYRGVAQPSTSEPATPEQLWTMPKEELLRRGYIPTVSKEGKVSQILTPTGEPVPPAAPVVKPVVAPEAPKAAEEPLRMVEEAAPAQATATPAPAAAPVAQAAPKPAEVAAVPGQVLQSDLTAKEAAAPVVEPEKPQQGPPAPLSTSQIHNNLVAGRDLEATLAQATREHVVNAIATIDRNALQLKLPKSKEVSQARRQQLVDAAKAKWGIDIAPAKETITSRSQLTNKKSIWEKLVGYVFQKPEQGERVDIEDVASENVHALLGAGDVKQPFSNLRRAFEESVVPSEQKETKVSPVHGTLNVSDGRKALNSLGRFMEWLNDYAIEQQERGEPVNIFVRNADKTVRTDEAGIPVLNPNLIGMWWRDVVTPGNPFSVKKASRFGLRQDMTWINGPSKVSRVIDTVLSTRGAVTTSEANLWASIRKALNDTTVKLEERTAQGTNVPTRPVFARILDVLLHPPEELAKKKDFAAFSLKQRLRTGLWGRTKEFERLQLQHLKFSKTDPTTKEVTPLSLKQVHDNPEQVTDVDLTFQQNIQKSSSVGEDKPSPALAREIAERVRDVIDQSRRRYSDLDGVLLFPKRSYWKEVVEASGLERLVGKTIEGEKLSFADLAPQERELRHVNLTYRVRRAFAELKEQGRDTPEERSKAIEAIAKDMGWEDVKTLKHYLGASSEYSKAHDILDLPISKYDTNPQLQQNLSTLKGVLEQPHNFEDVTRATAGMLRSAKRARREAGAEISAGVPRTQESEAYKQRVAERVTETGRQGANVRLAGWKRNPLETIYAYSKRLREQVQPAKAAETPPPASNLPSARSKATGERLAVANPATGEVFAAPGPLARHLETFPPEKRAAVANAVLSHEQVHLATSEAEAAEMGRSVSRLERAIATRLYMGKGQWSAERAGLTDAQVGWEIIRQRIERLSGASHEAIEAAGREKWTVRSLELLDTIIQKWRKIFDGKRYANEAMLLDRARQNLAIAKQVAIKFEATLPEGNLPAARRNYEEKIRGIELNPHQKVLLFDAVTSAFKKKLEETHTTLEHPADAATRAALKAAQTFLGDTLYEQNSGGIRAYVNRLRSEAGHVVTPEESRINAKKGESRDLEAGQARVIKALNERKIAYNQTKEAAMPVDEAKKTLSALRDEKLQIFHPLEYKVPTLREPKANETFGQEATRLFLNKMDSMWSRLQNFGKWVDRAILPIDVMFDMLDEGKAKFNGFATRYIRQALDAPFDASLELRDQLAGPVLDLMKKYKFSKADTFRIGVVAHSEQEGGDRVLINSGIATKENVGSVIKYYTDAMRPQDRELLNAMREQMYSMRPMLEDVYHVAYGKVMKYVKNYFPRIRDWRRYQSDEVEPFAALKEGKPTEDIVHDRGNDALFEAMMLSPEHGFMMERTGPKGPVLIDALDTFTRHIADLSHFVVMELPLRRARGIAASQRFGEIYGKGGKRMILDWINTVATQGRNAPRTAWLDMMRRNTTAGVIAYRLASNLVHVSNTPLSWMHIATVTGARKATDYYCRAMKEVINKGDNLEWFRKNMRESYERGAGEFDYLSLVSNDRSFMAKVAKPGFAIMRGIDLLNTQATTLAIYMAKLDQMGIDSSKFAQMPVNAEAMAFARAKARRAVASPLYKDVPQIIAKGGSWWRLMFQFMNTFLDQFSNMRHETMIGFRDLFQGGSPQLVALAVPSIATMLMLESGIKLGSEKLWQGLAGYKPAKDERETLAQQYWEKVLHESLRRVPFFGNAQQLITSATRVVRGEPTDLRIGIPGVDAEIRALQKLIEMATNPSERSGPLVKLQAAEAVGTAGGLPGTVQAGEYLENAAKGVLSRAAVRDVERISGKSINELTLPERWAIARQQMLTKPAQTARQRQAEEQAASRAQFHRQEQIMESLSPAARRWLDKNQLIVAGYKGTLQLGGMTVPLTREERIDYERRLDTGTQEVVDRLMQIPNFETLPNYTKRNILSKALESMHARKRAEVMRDITERHPTSAYRAPAAPAPVGSAPWSSQPASGPPPLELRQ